MYTTEELINDCEKFNHFVNSLGKTEETLFFGPIAEGKWSVAEIISHISFWDKYIREEMLPSKVLILRHLITRQRITHYLMYPSSIYLINNWKKESTLYLI